MRAEIAQAISAYVADKIAEVDLCGSFHGKYVKCEACGYLSLAHDIEVLTVYSYELLLCGQCRNRTLKFLLAPEETKQDPRQSTGTSVKGDEVVKESSAFEFRTDQW